MKGIVIPVEGFGDDESPEQRQPPSWQAIAEEYGRRHGERMSTTQAKRIHDVAVWKMRAALGIAWGIPLRKYIEKHGIAMTGTETASA